MKFNYDIKSAFAEALQKSGVESIIKHRQTMQDKITDILNPEHKFKSISDKIKDMQERAGIFKLENVKKANEEKQTFLKDYKESIKIFELFPKIKEAILKFIEENPFTSKPAIINKIRTAAQGLMLSKNIKTDVNELLEEESFQKYIDALVEKFRKAHEFSENKEISLESDNEISPEDEKINNDIFGGIKHV